MPRLNNIRTSLSVGFADGKVPVRLQAYLGRDARAIPVQDEFPYEEAQFQVVLLSIPALTRKLVKEAHRVLRAEGCLVFSVPEKSSRQEGFSLPDIYSIVREGFNIVSVDVTPPRWQFWFRRREMTICAAKKNWRAHTNTYRPYVV